MNKISHIDLYFDIPWLFHNENNEQLRTLEQIDETYGIKRNVVGGRFEISDQSKFMLFMLKYPEIIAKIVYE